MKFIAEYLTLKLTKVELLNILGHLQENPKKNHFTIIKIKKQLNNKEGK